MPHDHAPRCIGLVHSYDKKPKRRLFEIMCQQGLQVTQNVRFLTDGGEEVRGLTRPHGPDTYDDIVDACRTAWNGFTAQPEHVSSIGTRTCACISHDAGHITPIAAMQGIATCQFDTRGRDRSASLRRGQHRRRP